MAKKKTTKKSVTAPVPAGAIVNPPPRQVPPPPPPKKGPPPPPPNVNKASFVETAQHEAAALRQHKMINHPKAPPDATHLEFTYKPVPGKVPTIVTGPIKMFSDFSSIEGTMRYGKLVGTDTFRYHPDFLPESERRRGLQQGEQETIPEAEDTPSTPRPPRPPRAPGSGKREGVCSFIDDTIMEGNRTVAEILEIVMAKFPGRDAKATESTIRCRPSHIKKKGLTPPPFKK